MHRRRNPIDSLRGVVLLLVAVSLAIAPKVWAVSYDAGALAAVVAAHEAEVAAHEAEIEAHGHAHEDRDLERHAFDHHWSEIADIEQSSGWLLPSSAKGSGPRGDASAAVTAVAPRAGPVQPFERPPRG